MRPKFDLPTPEEDAAIQRGIEADPDTFELTDEFVAGMRPAAEVLPHIVRRGPQKAARKVPVSIRLDADLVRRLRASGPGWQGRVNDLLRKAGV